MAKIFDKNNTSPDKKMSRENSSNTTDKTSSVKGKKKGKGDIKMNLIKDEIVNYFDWEKNLVVLLIAVGLAVALITGAYWGVSWWGTNKQQEQVQQAIEAQKNIELNKDLNNASQEMKKIKKFEKKMAQAEQILDSHVYWTNFFHFLERNTLSQVHYQKFGGGVDGEYSLSAEADEYGAIEKQVEKFANNKYVEKVNVNSASVSLGQEKEVISFNLELVVSPDVFTNYSPQ